MTDHSEDQELVERMLAGDEEAFETFAERYSKALYRFALSRLGGDRDLTRDAVQTTMTQALAKLDQYRGEASLLTWLCACCRNEVLMHRRRCATRPAAVELDDAAEPAVGSASRLPASPEAAVLRQEVRRRVHVCLDVLPDRYARALEWKYVERLPVRDIAERLGVGPKAAESLLTRARQAFRDRWPDVQASGGGEG